MAAIPGSVRFTGFVAPTDSTDIYAVTDPTYGRGSLRSVADISARNAITLDRRSGQLGMEVVTIDTMKKYRLINEPGTPGTTNSDWEEIVSINDAITKSIFVDQGFTGVSNGAATTPYKTIMDAVNSIPDAVSGDDAGLKTIYCIYVYSGQYDEDVIIPTAKTPHIIQLIAMGSVYLGSSTGTYFNNPVTPRSIEWRLTKLVTFSTPVRPTFSLLSITPEATVSTHLFYGKSGWRITGNLLIGDISSDGNTSSTEFHFENVWVNGNVTYTADSHNMGNTNMIIYGCRFQGNFDFPYSGSPLFTVNINSAGKSSFECTTFRVATIGIINDCYISNGFNINSNNSNFQPAPYISGTKIVGAITSNTATSFIMDLVSHQLSDPITATNITFNAINLPNGTTATTQAFSDNSTLLATTASLAYAAGHNLYLDVSRTEPYTPDGTTRKPYKTFSQLITFLNSQSPGTFWVVNVASGTYSETSITIPNVRLVVYGGKSILNLSGTFTSNTTDLFLIDFNITASNSVYNPPGPGTYSFDGCNLGFNITFNGNVTYCYFTRTYFYAANAVVNGIDSYYYFLECIFLPSRLSGSGNITFISGRIYNSYAGYVLDSSTNLIVSQSSIENTAGGAINCDNGSISSNPNSINNVVVKSPTVAVNYGTSYTVLGKNNLISGSLSGTPSYIVAYKNDVIGSATIMKVGSDSPYDMYCSDGSNILTNIAPNTTTDQKFLAMTGDGVNGNFPTWESVSALIPSGAGPDVFIPTLGQTSFTLSQTPISNTSFLLFFNGQQTLSYTLVGTSLTWTGASLVTTDRLVAIYNVVSGGAQYTETGNIAVNWTAPTASPPTTNIRLIKIGNKVSLYMENWSATGNGTSANIDSTTAVIPVGYRPATTTYGMVFTETVISSVVNYNIGRVLISNTGTISVRKDSSSSNFNPGNGENFAFKQGPDIGWIL